ncbi:MAG: PAS domain S-box protein [Chitinophagaceae bacterium]|nr:MAG: PAS domain S-box protein [Chitinophagaceae bacterium]
MPTKVETKPTSLELEHLPGYAQFLLAHRLEELTSLQHKLALEDSLPLLRQVAHLDAEAQRSLLRFFVEELLTYLAGNRAAEWVERSIEHWTRNGFPFDKHALVPEDIIKTSYIRKKSFLHFLQEYCGEGAQMLQVIDDLDRFQLHHSTQMMVTYNRVMQEHLQDREAQLLDAQSIAHIGSYVWDLESRQSTVTPELTLILEVENDMPGFLKNVHDEDRQRVEGELEASLQSGVFDSEFRYNNSKGIRFLWSRGKVHYKDGKPVSVSGTVMDITDRQQLMDQVREKEIFLRKLADATPSIIASYNINTGRYTFVSEGMEKILGYSPEAVYDAGIAWIAEKIHPDDLASLMKQNERVLEEANAAPESEPVAEFRYRIRHADGSWRWLQTFGTIFDRNAAGKVEHILNISLDVSAQLEAEHKISEQEYFIQQIADASPMVLYLFDCTSGRFHYLNREIFYVLGYTPDEVLAMSADEVRALYHPEDQALLPERAGSDSHFQYHESMMQYECRLRKKDGSWYWLLAREIVFKKDAQGAVQQILGAALDINRRKEMERTLLQNSFQLEQSNASLEEFAYVASHDLKEPLRKISTFGDRLVASQMDRMSDDGKIYLSKVVDASQRMQAMIDDLLSVSRISGDRGFEEVSLQALLEDAQQALEFKIEQKGARVEVDEPLPTARVVPSQFRQLFQNLLSNSLKFAREGIPPVVHVRYGYRRPDEVPAGLTKTPSYLELTFTDNGIGFEQEYASKIFQIFQRLHGRSEFEGNGIGLAIVKKIAEHHGGTIYAAGTPDEGAVFTLILPV